MEFRILGPSIEARLDAASAPIDLGGNKQQRVLAALLLAKGHVVSNDRLIDAVWGDQPPAKPNVTLRSYVSHLRRVLEPDRGAGQRSLRIATRAPGYAISVNPDEVDAWQFELDVAAANTALAAGDLAEAHSLARQALDRWSATDLQAGVLEPFDAEVQRLDDLRRVARHLVHESMLRSGRHLEALPSLEAELRSDPFDEGVRQQLMLALYRCGRQADALGCFTEGRTLLREELGLDPSTELAGLEHQILTNDPALAWVAEAEAVGRGNQAGASPEVAVAGLDPLPPAGRGPEAEALVAALDQSLAENVGGLFVVTGEPGIGKSTLLRHGIEAAINRGFELSVGRCHEGSSDSTLFPWITAWRPLMERLEEDELQFVVGSMGHWLAQILPELGERLGVAPEPSSDRYTLFEAIGRALRAGSTVAPVCFVIEDLHWADENSVRLLGTLAEAVADCPVVILASWRDTEVVSPDVGVLLDEVLAKALNSLRLKGLDPDAIATILTSEAQRSNEPQLSSGHTSAAEAGAVADERRRSELLEAEQLAARTGGNPLFVTELVRSKQLTGEMSSSDTVRSAINSRLRRLPPGATTSLAVGALCLDGFSEELVATVLDLNADDVLDQMEAALAARLIEEDPDDSSRFRLSHDLFAETLIEGLSGPRRARYHTQLGRALESDRAPVGVLAHHFLNGTGPEASLKGGEYALNAAIAALSLFDHEGAERLLEAALAAIDSIDDDALLTDVLLNLATVKKFTASPPEVHAAAERAFESARRLGDVRRMARVAIAFEGSSGLTESDADPTWLGYWCPPGVIIPMIEECLGKLTETDPYVPALQAALGLQYFGEFEDLEIVDRSLAASVASARLQDNPAELSLALHRRHDALQRVLGIEERADLLEEAISCVNEDRNPLQLVSLRRARAVLALDKHDLAAAHSELAVAMENSAAAGRTSAVMNTEVGELALLLLQGHLDEAEERLDKAFVTYERFGEVMLDQFGLQLAALWRERHRHEEVLELLDFKIIGYPGPAFAAPKAAILTELDRFDEATALVGSFDSSDLVSAGEPILQFLTPSFFAEAIANLDDPVLAAQLLPTIEPAVGRVVSVYDGIMLLPPGGLFAGRLHTTLGNYDEAERLLSDADEHLEHLDAHPGRVRIALAQADLAVKRNQPHLIGALIEQAEAMSVRGGERWLIDRWLRNNPGRV